MKNVRKGKKYSAANGKNKLKSILVTNVKKKCTLTLRGGKFQQNLF